VVGREKDKIKCTPKTWSTRKRGGLRCNAGERGRGKTPRKKIKVSDREDGRWGPLHGLSLWRKRIRVLKRKINVSQKEKTTH